MLPRKGAGTVMDTVAGSSALATPAPESSVDRGREPRRRREVGRVEGQHDLLAIGHRAARLHLHQPAAGHAASGQMVDLHVVGPVAGPEPAQRQRALPQGHHLAIHASQWRRHEGATLQASGVANRRDEDVETHAWPRERRQFGAHHHGRDVLDLHHLGRHHHAEPLEGVGHRQVREERLALVARPVQPDDESVADERRRAHPHE